MLVLRFGFVELVIPGAGTATGIVIPIYYPPRLSSWVEAFLFPGQSTDAAG